MLKAVGTFPATLVLLSGLCSIASAKIVYVNQNASGSNNGASWVNAYVSLRTGIAAAVSGDQVWIATGIYRPNDNNPTDLSRSQSFSLKTGVAIYGGFSGTETTLAQRNPILYPVTLSGDLLGDDSAAGSFAASSLSTMSDNSYSVISNSSVTATAVLDSAIIRGGNADGTGSVTAGGGMRNSSSSSTVTKCVFVDNRAQNGGAISNSLSSPTFTGCTFCFNTASLGGAIYNFHTQQATLVNCTLAHNTAGTGGAILNGTATLVAINTTIAFNSSNVVTTGNPSGSGIRSILTSVKDQQSNLYLYNCILWGNLNSLQLYGGNTTASNCIVEGGFSGLLQGIETYVLSNIRDADPLITPLTLQSSQTPSISLSADSPAINTGISALLSPLSIPSTDQLGLARDPKPDLGAIEYPIYVPTGADAPAVTLGSSANLPAGTALASPTYQWYQGRSGDTSSPVPGATSATLNTAPLSLGTDFWVAVTSAGLTIPSSTVSVPVRGTYAQWTAFHGLTGNDALPAATPAFDDISNLVKFACGLDLLIPTTSSAFLKTSTDATIGQFDLDLTLSKTPTDLSWDFLELSPTSDWTPVTVSTVPTVSTTAFQTHRLSVPATSAGRIFKARIVSTP